MSDEAVTVVFGEWLIFDSFDDWHGAARFAAWVEAEFPGREVRNGGTGEEAQRLCLFPYELHPPIILVQRDEGWTDEEMLETAVERFGGTAAGT